MAVDLTNVKGYLRCVNPASFTPAWQVQPRQNVAQRVSVVPLKLTQTKPTVIIGRDHIRSPDQPLPPDCAQLPLGVPTDEEDISETQIAITHDADGKLWVTALDFRWTYIVTELMTTFTGQLQQLQKGVWQPLRPHDVIVMNGQRLLQTAPYGGTPPQNGWGNFLGDSQLYAYEYLELGYYQSSQELAELSTAMMDPQALVGLGGYSAATGVGVGGVVPGQLGNPFGGQATVAAAAHQQQGMMGHAAAGALQAAPHQGMAYVTGGGMYPQQQQQQIYGGQGMGGMAAAPAGAVDAAVSAAAAIVAGEPCCRGTLSCRGGDGRRHNAQCIEQNPPQNMPRPRKITGAKKPLPGGQGAGRGGGLGAARMGAAKKKVAGKRGKGPAAAQSAMALQGQAGGWSGGQQSAAGSYQQHMAAPGGSIGRCPRMVAGANAAFDAFDQDRDGYLNIQELRNLQSITFPGETWDDRCWQPICQKLHCDPHLGLPKDSFYSMYEAIFSRCPQAVSMGAAPPPPRKRSREEQDHIYG